MNIENNYDKVYIAKNYIENCMDIMMGMVREDNLITYFGSTRSRATIRIADTSTERGCQSKC